MTLLAQLINLVLKTSASNTHHLPLSMSQSVQTDITDTSIRRHRMNTGNCANLLSRTGCAEPPPSRPLAVEGPSTSSATERSSAFAVIAPASTTDNYASVSDPVLYLPSTKLNKPLPQTHYLGTCTQCHSNAYMHRCLSCCLVFYCTSRCQYLHWERHREFCQKIKFMQGRADE